MMEMLSTERIEQMVRDRFPQAVEDSAESAGVLTLHIRADDVSEVCALLKHEPGFDFDYLLSLTGVDWTDRLEVVYHLYSIKHKHYVTLKVKTDRESPRVPSVTSVWKSADWQEREVYDMFGIEFHGHPDLRRILLDQDWQGFPLRKDYVGE